MDTNRISWLAGLLEGEGSFALDLQETRRNGKVWARWYLRVQLSMTDRDVVEEARRVAGGIGKIYTKKPGKQGHKTQYAWQVTKSEEAYALMIAVLPQMGERRTETIREAITSWLQIKPKRSRTHCPQGHEFTPENTAIDTAGYRRCRQCARDRDRRRSE